MTAIQAKILEYAIVGLCVASLAAIFQPYSLTLFSIGCVTVIIGGLSFNLVPFCREGVPFRFLGRVVLIVIVVLTIAALLGMGTAQLYVFYIGSLR